MKSISILIPAYNEAENVRQVYEAVTRVMRTLGDRYAYEILFTDNHSTDATPEILREIATGDPRVRVVRFSKNFGLQQSLFAAYALCSGDAAIQLDCDLQDPPELIPDFLGAWERGHQVVYGIRRTRKEGQLLTRARKVFYKLLSRLGSDDLPLDAGEFRLVDRVLIREVIRFAEYSPFLRTSIAWMGFRQIGIPYDRAERAAGRSKFPLAGLISFALDGIVAHSVAPLRLATLAGLALGVVTAGATAFRLLGGGPDAVVLLLLFATSLNALLLGLIGEYLGRLYSQSRGRPIAIIESTINLPEAPASIRGGGGARPT